MKKLLCLLLAMVLVFAFAACGGSNSGDSSGSEAASDFEWTRQGNFQDADENYLMVVPSEDEEHAGMWAVTLMVGEETHGWFIAQEGETLHGDLTSEFEEDADPYVVTISEEGEDGLLVETEAGDQFHFTPMETPEIIATLQINVDGLGEIAVAPEGEEAAFDDEFPMQSHVLNIMEGQPTTYTIIQRPAEDYTFVKWTKNGEDFSTDESITVDVTEDVEYRAVFEHN